MDFSQKKKKYGTDENVSREKRADKSHQIRKDKRNDRANLLRRRFQLEEEEGQDSKKPSRSNQTVRRNLDALPQKAINLHSEKIEEVLDAAIYIRKLLAFEKTPPVNLVVDSGVLPRLVNLLSRNDLPLLQLEVAWAISNIACAEVQYARILIDSGAIAPLISLIADSNDDAVREQSLWALGNISADVNDCRDLLLAAGILTPLLWQLGIDCPPHRKSLSPSLFTMRHVTWTCANLIRGFPYPPFEVFRAIVYAFAELLHSPDEEVLTNVCVALSTICEVGSDNIQLVMEQGIFSRLKELCEVATIRESAVTVICTALRSTDSLQSKVLLSSRYGGVLQMVISEIYTATQDKTRMDVFQTLRFLFDTDSKYITKSLSLGILEAIFSILGNGVYDVCILSGHCLCCIATDCSDKDAIAVLSQSLPHVCNLLSTTESALLISALLSVTRASRIVLSAVQGQTSCQVSSPYLDKLKSLTLSADLHSRIGLLASHPSSDIATHASQLENLLGQLLNIENEEL